AAVSIIDALGRRTGFDTSTSQSLQEIPQSAYCRDALDSDEVDVAARTITHSVQLFQPSGGKYQILVTGVNLGLYSISARPFSRDGSAQPPILIQGIGAPGSTSAFQIEFNPSPGADSPISRVATFASTLQDLENAASLQLIDNRGIANSLKSKLQAAQKAAG